MDGGSIPSVIVFSLRGTRICTTMSTIEGSAMLSSLVTNHYRGTVLSALDNGGLFIDRDPEMFRVVLEVLSNVSVTYTKRLMEELQYFGVSSIRQTANSMYGELRELCEEAAVRGHGTMGHAKTMMDLYGHQIVAQMRLAATNGKTSLLIYRGHSGSDIIVGDVPILVYNDNDVKNRSRNYFLVAEFGAYAPEVARLIQLNYGIPANCPHGSLSITIDWSSETPALM